MEYGIGISPVVVGAVFVAALVSSLVATPLIRLAAIRLSLLDHPNRRSSHHAVTPRGGGVAVLASAAAALAGAASYWLPEREAGALLGAAALLAVVGLVDDRRGVPALGRLLVQFAAAALAVATLGSFERVPLPPPLDVPLGVAAVPLTLLWITAVANFYNFMDGIDGLAGVQGVVTGLTIGAAQWSALAALVGAGLAGGSLGFLKLNWSPARIFMGDVGSVPIGFLFAVLPLTAPPELRGAAFLVVVLSLWFFLADPTWTLLLRLSRGEPLHEAHRTHLYQLLVAAGASHARVSAGIGVAAAGLSALALAAFFWREAAWAWAALGLGIVLFAAEFWLVRTRAGGLAPA